MDPRDKKQKDVVDEYLITKPLHTTWMLGTGFGKARCAINLILELSDDVKYVIILANSIDIRDNVWRIEFGKMNQSKFYENRVRSFTYSFAYSKSKKSMNIQPNTLVIFDEVDFIADTNKLHKCFNIFKKCRILGLTGFITESKQAWFKNNIPISQKYTIEQAQKEQVLNDVEYVFVKYELSSAKDIKVEYKDRLGKPAHFMTNEISNYVFKNKAVNNALAEVNILESKRSSGGISFLGYKNAKEVIDKKILWTVGSRRAVLNNLNSSILIVNKILKFLSEDDKCVIFSENVKQSKRLCDNVFNTSNTSSKNITTMEDFNSGKINTLGVCGKINRGTNIENLTVAIFESYNGSDTIFIQKKGRMCRLELNKIAKLYILLPFYRDLNTATGDYELKETQAVKWARNMLRSSKIKNHSTIDFRKI